MFLIFDTHIFTHVWHLKFLRLPRCQDYSSSKNNPKLCHVQSHEGFPLLIKAYSTIINYSILNTHQFSAKLPLCNFEISIFLSFARSRSNRFRRLLCVYMRYVYICAVLYASEISDEAIRRIKSKKKSLVMPIKGSAYRYYVFMY